MSRANRFFAFLVLMIAAGVFAPKGAEALPFDFYYSEGCRSCIEFLDRKLPDLIRGLSLDLDVRRHDLLDTQTFEEFQKRVAEVGVRVSEVPVIFIGPVVLQGEEEITDQLEPVLEEVQRLIGEGEPVVDALNTVAAARRRALDVDTDATGRVMALPVLAAGLLDGINPCAFTTLIFMLAALTVAGRSRREIFILGLFFAASVFVTYTLIGFGFFQVVRAASAFPVIAKIIRWLLVAVLLVFAVLSLYDWTKIRAGRASEIVLQLPMAVKRRIHSSIRTYARGAALAGSALVLGFLVSVFELACTGQVYFPTLTYLARVEADVRSYLLLLLYNVGFVLPLLAVFAVSYAGVSSQRIAGVFTRHLGAVKLGTAALFLALAMLTIFM